MVIGVKADLVPRKVHLLHQLRLVGRLTADEEKGGVNAAPGKTFQQAWGADGVRAVVKGEGDELFRLRRFLRCVGGEDGFPVHGQRRTSREKKGKQIAAKEKQHGQKKLPALLFVLPFSAHFPSPPFQGQYMRFREILRRRKLENEIFDRVPPRRQPGVRRSGIGSYQRLLR